MVDGAVGEPPEHLDARRPVDDRPVGTDAVSAPEPTPADVPDRPG